MGGFSGLGLQAVGEGAVAEGFAFLADVEQLAVHAYAGQVGGPVLAPFQRGAGAPRQDLQGRIRVDERFVVHYERVWTDYRRHFVNCNRKLIKSLLWGWAIVGGEGVRAYVRAADTRVGAVYRPCSRAGLCKKKSAPPFFGR